jgi:hypothetical protein
MHDVTAIDTTTPVVGVASEVIDAEAVQRQAEARDIFYAFRIQMHPHLLTNWWTKEISWELQWFYEDLIAGKAAPVERSPVFFLKHGRGSQRGEKGARVLPSQTGRLRSPHRAFGLGSLRICN